LLIPQISAFRKNSVIYYLNLEISEIDLNYIDLNSIQCFVNKNYFKGKPKLYILLSYGFIYHINLFAQKIDMIRSNLLLGYFFYNLINFINDHLWCNYIQACLSLLV